jgi:VWFA-related protein
MPRRPSQAAILNAVKDPCILSLRQITIIALLLFLLSTPLSAQTPTLTTQSTLILVPTTVQTAQGEILYGLRPDQFVLKDNGIRQTVHVEEDTDALGLSLVIVVQCSRNAYRDLPRLRTLATMIEGLVGSAPHQVAVVTYGTEPTLLGDFTKDPAELRDTLSQIAPCHDDDKAATLDAVAYASALLDARNEAARKDHTRHAILLISETRDHGSQIKPEDAVAALGRTNTVVDSIAFTPAKTQLLDELRNGSYGPTNYIPLMVMAVNALKNNVPYALSSLSGGEYINYTTQRGFDQGLHRLSNHIHNYYLLSFQPPAPPVPGLHKIEVHIPDYPTAQIRTRQTYYAPPR